MKKIFLVLTVFLLGFNVFSQNLEDIVNKKYLSTLKENGTVTVIHEKKDKTITMVPDCTYAEQIKSDLICEKNSGVPFLAEFLYLIPKSTLTDDVEKVNIDSLSVIFRSISKMEGMEYIHNGGKKDVLYKKAYRIANAESDEKLPDITEGSADGVELFAYQHDHTFGKTKYKLNYHQNENELFATFLNVIPMSKLGVKAVMPENLRMNVLAIDLGDDLLLYLAADVNSKNIVGIRGQIEDSMTVRMDAIYRWFLTQYK